MVKITDTLGPVLQELLQTEGHVRIMPSSIPLLPVLRNSIPTRTVGILSQTPSFALPGWTQGYNFTLGETITHPDVQIQTQRIIFGKDTDVTPLWLTSEGVCRVELGYPRGETIHILEPESVVDIFPGDVGGWSPRVIKQMPLNYFKNK